eukprot:m.415048 g.415048  ORF g.415048 m.415048 type:complete len:139 (-) comp29517_c0_seq1:192-608(-)
MAAGSSTSPYPAPVGLETPSMKQSRVKWEERQTALSSAKSAAVEGTGTSSDKQVFSETLTLDTTLVTESMGSNEEAVAFDKSKSCVSGQSKAQLTGPVPKGYKDSVERNFQYDAEKAIRLGKTTTKKSYAVIKPYFQY